MSKCKYMNNEQYFLILRYLETTTNKCDQISFEKMEEKNFHQACDHCESFLSLDFRMGTSSTNSTETYHP